MLIRCRHPALYAEERFLLRIAKLGVSRDDCARAEAVSRGAGFSWDRMLTLATQHGVGALVAHSLQQAPQLRTQVPDRIQKQLELAQFTAKLRTALYAQAVGPVMGDLALRNIPCALMKGVALTETIYPPGTRRLHDLDLLVRRSDYPSAAAALESHGFHKALRGRSEQQLLQDYHQITFVKRHAETVLGVDLHWLMYPASRPFFVDTPILLSRARPHWYGGVPILTFSPEDLLVHYATQLVNDGLRTSFSRAVDIHALVQRGIRWHQLCAAAQGARAMGVTCVALGLAELLGAVVPAWVPRRMEYECPGCRTATALLADPRWLLGRWFLPSPARQVIASLLEVVPRRRVAHAIALPRRYWLRGIGPDVSTPRAAARTAAASLQTLGSWAGLVSLQATDAWGDTRASQWIRARFWQPKV